jgi:hypothetical protein
MFVRGDSSIDELQLFEPESGVVKECRQFQAMPFDVLHSDASKRVVDRFFAASCSDLNAPGGSSCSKCGQFRSGYSSAVAPQI